MASPIGQFLLQQLEGRLGLTVADTEEVQALRESAADFAIFREEAAQLAYHSLDYFSGNPQDLRPEARNRLAQRSRIALMVDPLAGAEGDLRANFAFGRGVAMPEAEDPNVQKIIEEAWTDPVNAEKLTSFEAQQHRSRELLSDANILWAAYVRNGRVRIGTLDVDRVTHVVPHPEDEERPLWYVMREKTADGRIEWDFRNHRWKTGSLVSPTGTPKVVYFEHWRNVEDVRDEEKRNGSGGGLGDQPAAADLNEGKVYHERINRIGRTQWGTPPFARTLRFMSAMNELVDAHVAMAQARSTFVAKRTRLSQPNQLTQAANSVLAQTGEIAAAQFGEGVWGHGDDPRKMPPPPGSVWLENPSDKLESLNLSSGAGEMAQTAQIVRAPISAAAGFQQGYLGDAQNAGSLASATALELPTLMNVQSWQETREQTLRWFIDLVLQEAVRAGRLGDDPSKATLDRSLRELHLQEAEQRAEAEQRTGKKLDYKITSPYPGRRQLPEVITALTTPLTAIPGGGRSPELLSRLLTFYFAQGLQSEDPKGDAEAVVDELQKTVWPELDKQAQLQLAVKGGATIGGGGGSPGGSGGSGGGPSPSPGGPKQNSEPTASGSGERKDSTGGAMSGNSAMQASLAELEALWETEVEVPVHAMLSGSTNGDGPDG